MSTIGQIGIIFGITLLGEGLSKGLNLPLPGNVLGMLFLLIFLLMKWVKVEQVEQVGDFLLKNMAFLFIPAGVSIIENLEVLQGKLVGILLICIVTTILTLGITGVTAQGIIYLQAKRKNEVSKEKNQCKK